MSLTRRQWAEFKRAARDDNDRMADACSDSEYLLRRASMGGEARAKALSPSRRSEIARAAARARWKRAGA